MSLLKRQEGPECVASSAYLILVWNAGFQGKDSVEDTS